MAVKTKGTTKKKKLVPPIKSSVWTHTVTRWVLEHFPANYEQYTFVEPFCGFAEMFLLKTQQFPEEVLNDAQQDLINIYWALRDEPAQFIERMKKVKHSEKSFKTALEKAEFDDYLDTAVNDFILRKMSRAGGKTVYLGSKADTWKDEVAGLSVVAERLKHSYIFNKKPLDVIKAFNDKDTLLYVNQHNSLYNPAYFGRSGSISQCIDSFFG